MRRFLIILSTLVFIVGGIGCTRYQRQVTSFKLPEG